MRARQGEMSFILLFLNAAHPDKPVITNMRFTIAFQPLSSSGSFCDHCGRKSAVRWNRLEAVTYRLLRAGLHWAFVSKSSTLVSAATLRRHQPRTINVRQQLVARHDPANRSARARTSFLAWRHSTPCAGTGTSVTRFFQIRAFRA